MVRPDHYHRDRVAVDAQRCKRVSVARVVTLIVDKNLVQTCPHRAPVSQSVRPSLGPVAILEKHCLLRI